MPSALASGPVVFSFRAIENFGLHLPGGHVVGEPAELIFEIPYLPSFVPASFEADLRRTAALAGSRVGQ